MPLPIRQTSNLHDFRYSKPHARYFITFTTQDRDPWLNHRDQCESMIAVLRAGHNAGEWRVLIATCMPDHVHVLFELGDRLTIGRSVARWKTLSKRCAPFGKGWQRDYWEHRVRPEELQENYGRYVFMNPYRAQLLSCSAAWMGTWLPDSAQFQFPEFLNDAGGPSVLWLGERESIVDEHC